MTNTCQKQYDKGIIQPPGNEIYRDDRLSVFEVQGGSPAIEATEILN